MGPARRVTSPKPRLDMRAAVVAVVGMVVGMAALGCQRELDMARAYDRSRAATTIRYLGVREATRLYPDYGAIDASILNPGVGE